MRKRWGLVLTCAILSFALAAPAQAAARSGRPGPSYLVTGTCKYMYTGSQGWLRATVAPPIVRSPNIRPGRGNDALWVRYRLSFVNYWGGALVARSGWSGWLRTRDVRYRTWDGFSYFDGLWNGVYQVRYRIEWWNRTRRVGARSMTLQSYHYYDDQGAGPSGPNRACFRES